MQILGCLCTRAKQQFCAASNSRGASGRPPLTGGRFQVVIRGSPMVNKTKDGCPRWWRARSASGFVVRYPQMYRSRVVLGFFLIGCWNQTAALRKKIRVDANVHSSKKACSLHASIFPLFNRSLCTWKSTCVKIDDYFSQPVEICRSPIVVSLFIPGRSEAADCLTTENWPI